jgi:hypothetical protein
MIARSAAARRTTAPQSAADVIDRAGPVSLQGVSTLFGMTSGQIAETAGLARETLQKTDRRNAPKTQGRLREMLEILRRVEAWAGGPAQAMAWYRAEPIPAFGDRTAESLVKSGEAAALRDYLDHVATGGYA